MLYYAPQEHSYSLKSFKNKAADQFLFLKQEQSNNFKWIIQ